jgi:hypothetical protein
MKKGTVGKMKRGKCVMNERWNGMENDDLSFFSFDYLYDLLLLL